MDVVLEILFGTIGAIVSIAGLFAGLGYLKKSRTDGKLDTINLFKEQVDALITKVNDQENKIRNLTSEIQSLHAANDEKEKKLEEVLQILQGRDPKMQEVIKKIEEYIEAAKPATEALLKVVPVIDELDKFLKAQKVVGTVLSQK